MVADFVTADVAAVDAIHATIIAIVVHDVPKVFLIPNLPARLGFIEKKKVLRERETDRQNVTVHNVFPGPNLTTKKKG